MFEMIDGLCVNTLRTLSIDMIQKANSGHPGLPLGASPFAYVLWTKFLKYDPQNPDWPDRDRFVLSAGHGSALLYSLLHLTGYDLSLDDIKKFRQWDSKTPGHPEEFLTPGVEATTGPLGQGTANAVGMAIAERALAHRFNRPDFNIVDHFTYALAGDGDLMEGVSAEASSLAGHLKLGKLIFLYDSNDISLDGPTSLTFTGENILKRYEAYGWQTIRVEDADTDLEGIHAAIELAKSDTSRPSIIEFKTTIGYGSPNKAGNEASHGAPLGAEEVVLTKKALGWVKYDEEFYIPVEAREHFKAVVAEISKARSDWSNLFIEYKKKYPDLARDFALSIVGKLPDGWDADLPEFTPGEKIATRIAGTKALNIIAKKILFIFGTDADLSCSTKGKIDDGGSFDGVTGEGRNLRSGVREHAMAAIANGICWHKGLRPFTSTFFVFSDYMKPSIRLAAMNNLPVIYIWTHDSIGVGEDGPTHQPVEHLDALRIIPNMAVVRPADASEAVESWRWALQQKDRPVGLIFSRQNVPVLDREKLADASNLKYGAYVISDCDGDPDTILIATGSEVYLALEAQENLAKDGIKSRVVSMPCMEVFEEQSQEYIESVLPPAVTTRVSIEAGSTYGWKKWVGDKGIAIGIDRFGSSAPGNVIFEKYGITSERIVAEVKGLIGIKSLK